MKEHVIPIGKIRSLKQQVAELERRVAELEAKSNKTLTLKSKKNA
jgi:BMFP domain-containing protein YqiC